MQSVGQLREARIRRELSAQARRARNVHNEVYIKIPLNVMTLVKERVFIPSNLTSPDDIGYFTELVAKDWLQDNHRDVVDLNSLQDRYAYDFQVNGRPVECKFSGRPEPGYFGCWISTSWYQIQTVYYWGGWWIILHNNRLFTVSGVVIKNLFNRQRDQHYYNHIPNYRPNINNERGLRRPPRTPSLFRRR